MKCYDNFKILLEKASKMQKFFFFFLHWFRWARLIKECILGRCQMFQQKNSMINKIWDGEARWRCVHSF